MIEFSKDTTIGVIGSGTMGSGIAQIASTAGHRVICYDKNPEALQKAGGKLSKILARQVEKGRMTEQESNDIYGRIEFTENFSLLKDAGLVIEAIIENLEIKQNLFKGLEEIISQDAVLATNTSSLSIVSIASQCKNPGRVIGLHFFNPAPLMPLVEVVPAVTTNSGLAGKCRELMLGWGKKPAIVKDTPGFIVNRVARPFYGEALRIYEEGIADFATIDNAMKSLGGFRMGPFELMDFIGNDVNFKVTETVFRQMYFDPRYKPSITQQRYMEGGLLGRKTGRGFYDYSENAEKPQPEDNPEIANYIFERVLAMLINEAADALLLNIAGRDDLDSAMKGGVNYPKGLLAWADEFGIEKTLGILQELYEEYGEDRYRPSPLLRRMAKGNRKFYE